ncbi:flavin reductase family protein [Solicola sp. PLA-1-18]|uniref:flavin reductase family protein n=1 Tax=Solicola sp. PLA-1-18 TaxID=3380532 RepID=UPI003B7B37B2
MRRDFDPAEMDGGAFYQLLNSVVVPRPIAWVSSVSPDGVDNLAPHSFFTVASVSPPIVQFTSVGRKDSLTNIEASGEFVVALTPEPLFEQVNATGTDFPAGTSEFDAVGLDREPSLRVAAPRVAASPVALECVLHSTVSFGGSTVVFGRVVHAAVDDAVLDGDHPEITRLLPLSRLGANEWGTAGEIRDIARIRYADWPEGYRPA